MGTDDTPEDDDSNENEVDDKSDKKDQGIKRKQPEPTETVDSGSDDDGIEVVEESEQPKKKKLRKDTKTIEDQKRREKKGEELSTCLRVGTAVSAKFRGAFCEATIIKVSKEIKCRITFKNGLGTRTISEDFIKTDKEDGILVKGMIVKANHPDKDEYFNALITDVLDQSIYTVKFDDGDINTLKRNGLRVRKEPEKDKYRGATETEDLIEDMDKKIEKMKEINKEIPSPAEVKRNRRQPVSDNSVGESDKNKDLKKNKKVIEVAAKLLKTPDDEGNSVVLVVNSLEKSNESKKHETITIDEEETKSDGQNSIKVNKENKKGESTKTTEEKTNSDIQNNTKGNKQRKKHETTKSNEEKTKSGGPSNFKDNTSVLLDKVNKLDKTIKENKNKIIKDSTDVALQDKIKELEKSLSSTFEVPKPTPKPNPEVMDIDNAYPDIYEKFNPKKGTRGKRRARKPKLKRGAQPNINENKKGLFKDAKVLWDANDQGKTNKSTEKSSKKR